MAKIQVILISILLFLHFLLSGNLVDALLPATAKLFVHRRTLLMLEQYARPAIGIGLKLMHIPDQQLQSIGSTLKLEQIRIKKFDIEQNDLNIRYCEPNIVELTMKKLSIHMHMIWQYENFLFTLKGDANDTVITDFNIRTRLYADKSAKLAFSNSVNMNIHDIKVKLSGDGAPYLEKIAMLAVPLIKDLIAIEITKQVQEKLQNLMQTMLDGINVTYPLSDQIDLFWGLIPSNAEDATVNSSSLHAILSNATVSLYSDNSFIKAYKRKHDVNFDFIHPLTVPASHSIDVSGTIVCPSTGYLCLLASAAGAIKISVGEYDFGALQIVSPGECFDYTTVVTDAVACLVGDPVVVRIRHQGSCQPTSMHVRLCETHHSSQTQSPSYALSSSSDQNEHSITISSNLMTMSFAMEIEGHESYVPCMYPRHSLPLLEPDSERSPMLAFAMDEFVVNSFLFALMITQQLQLTIDDHMLPEDISKFLNTRAAATLLPDLFDMYPDARMQVSISPQAVPQFLFTSDGLLLRGSLIFDIGVLPALHRSKKATDTEIVISIVKLKLSFVMGANLWINAGINDNVQYLSGNLSALDMNLNGIEESIHFDNITDALQSFVRDVIDFIVFPGLNSLLAAGIEISDLPYMKLSQSILHFDEHRASFSTDFDINFF